MKIEKVFKENSEIKLENILKSIFDANIENNITNFLKITKSDYELFINDIDEQVKYLEHKIVITNKVLEKISDSSLLNELNRIKNEELSLYELTPELLHRFVKKINIEENGTPIISYRLTMPLSTLINN